MDFMCRSPTKDIAAICIALGFCSVMNLEAAVQTQSVIQLVLVVQWPITYCMMNYYECYCPLEADFLIHGLWNNSENCMHYRDFDMKKIDDLRERLNREWPSLWDCRNENFWQCEWQKHFSCIHEWSQEFYFKTALELHERVKGALTKQNIVPREKPYELDRIKGALHSSIGESPGISCNQNNQLHQIFFCFEWENDKSKSANYKPKSVSCPDDYQRCKRRTATRVYFPPNKPGWCSPRPLSCYGPVSRNMSRLDSAEHPDGDMCQS